MGPRADLHSSDGRTIFGSTPATCYAAKKRDPSARAIRDAEPKQQIMKAYEASGGVHGTRNIHAQLNRQGVRVARCTVQRLCRALGIRGLVQGKFPRTTKPAAQAAASCGSGRADIRGRCAEPVVGRRHHVCSHHRWMGVCGVRAGRLLAQDRGLADLDPSVCGPRDRCSGDGASFPSAGRAGHLRADSPLGSWRAVSVHSVCRVIGGVRGCSVGRFSRRFLR